MPPSIPTDTVVVAGAAGYVIAIMPVVLVADSFASAWDPFRPLVWLGLILVG